MTQKIESIKSICETCGKTIPEEFVNKICLDCYKTQAEENEKAKQESETERLKEEKKFEAQGHKKEPEVSVKEERGEESPSNGSLKAKFGILDPNYTENPEMEDKNQILANLGQFIHTHNEENKKKGILLWHDARYMYNFIRDRSIARLKSHPQFPKQIWKPHTVDVGCGSGVGSNVLSQESHITWGIDKNVWSIEFAQEAFTRERNNIYYSGQLTFDVFDPLEDSRQVGQFDHIVAIEIVEHIYDTDRFLRSLVRFARKDRKGSYRTPVPPSEFFISSPNRNSPKISKEKPKNPYHVREWTSQEFLGLLREYFEEVELRNVKGEPVPEDTDTTPMLAICRLPKVDPLYR
jgi:2-polyprenyl-3-methyl-5-hydroxy-6-metoxy-1,4-benzoquinol methylase